MNFNFGLSDEEALRRATNMSLIRDNELGKECPICFEEYDENDAFIALCMSCRQYVCYSCMNKEKNARNKCPFCRIRLQNVKIFSIQELRPVEMFGTKIETEDESKSETPSVKGKDKVEKRKKKKKKKKAKQIHEIHKLRIKGEEVSQDLVVGKESNEVEVKESSTPPVILPLSVVEEEVEEVEGEDEVEEEEDEVEEEESELVPIMSSSIDSQEKKKPDSQTESQNLLIPNRGASSQKKSKSNTKPTNRFHGKMSVMFKGCVNILGKVKQSGTSFISKLRQNENNNQNHNLNQRHSHNNSRRRRRRMSSRRRRRRTTTTTTRRSRLRKKSSKEKKKKKRTRTANPPLSPLPSNTNSGEEVEEGPRPPIINNEINNNNNNEP